MAAKSLKLEGYGTVMISSINIKEPDFETVDPTGAPVEHKTIGERARSVYVTKDGAEISSSQVCKKIEIEGEDIIAPKFQQSKEVAKDNIEEIDDNGLIYRAMDRKFYSVVCDNPKLKDLVINQHKSLQYPFVAGGGWKIWKGILTNWNGKLIMVCCRGDLQKELEKYSEETLELEIEVIPQHKNMKQLVKAMAMV